MESQSICEGQESGYAFDTAARDTSEWGRELILRQIRSQPRIGHWGRSSTESAPDAIWRARILATEHEAKPAKPVRTLVAGQALISTLHAPVCADVHARRVGRGLKWGVAPIDQAVWRVTVDGRRTAAASNMMRTNQQLVARRRRELNRDRRSPPLPELVHAQRRLNAARTDEQQINQSRRVDAHPLPM
jgi:hypothetical protein